MTKPMSFAAPASTPLVGQPFTLTGICIPVNATLTCNCNGGVGGGTVTIVASAPAACPRCLKVYHVAFNPTTMKLEIAMGVPDAAQEPS